MKKLVCMLAVLVTVLWGCGAVPTFETLGNVYAPEVPEYRRVSLTVPEDAVVQAGSASTGTIYFCDGYEILVETLAGGDLNRTLEQLSGFSADSLTLMQTAKGEYACYECVWTSAGEGGLQTAKTKILDDGAWHYCLTVLSPSEAVSALQPTVQAVFDSFSLN